MTVEAERHFLVITWRPLSWPTIRALRWAEVEGQGVSNSKATQPVMRVRLRARAAWG